LANAERLLGTFCANANARHAAAARTSPREVDVSTTSAAAADEPDAAGHRARAPRSLDGSDGRDVVRGTAARVAIDDMDERPSRE